MQYQAAKRVEVERQRDRRPQSGGGPSAAEHAAGRAQQDHRPGAIGRGGAGGRRRPENVRPLPAALPRRQPAFGGSPGRATGRS
ncbi:MAG: hypothetical protein DWQ37_00445 [Planctomycetota bacterium]|nr:MAG: hypothetical protein DWQ37_00445 [Planctomycetota bacterium]